MEGKVQRKLFGDGRWLRLGGSCREVISRDDPRRDAPDADVKPAKVFKSEAVILADAKDALDVSITEARDAQHRFTRCGIDVDGEGFRVTARPLSLGVDLEIEEGIFRPGDLRGVEAVEADEPVGLIETMLAHEGSGGERKARVGFWIRAEAGVVDALEMKRE